ncbi:MAG: ABC transporter ATP-binding protein [Myxococcota bacterium]
MRLEARNLTLGYHQDPPVVEGLDLVVPECRVTAVVGPNGCGKSTLLRALGRLLKPRTGTVTLDGRSLSDLSTRAVARRIAVLPQRPAAPDGLTVRDLVAQGRYPYQGWLRRWSRDDEEAIEDAMRITEVADLAHRRLDALSGGQAQRAWLAMVLAQQTDIVLLDEPTTFLDVAHQLDVLELLDHLNRERGRTVVMVLHDLNQAARYAHELVAMKHGRIVAQGKPADLVTEGLIHEVFELPCRIVADPVTGGPFCVPRRRIRT